MAEIPSPSSVFLLSSLFVSYRLAILISALVSLLLWQRCTTPAEVLEPAASPMAPTKRPRSTPPGPLAGFADAAARGNHDSLRSWAASLSDPELRENLEAAVTRISQDTTASKEELFHLRPLLCALAMEGGWRDIEGFTEYLTSIPPADPASRLFSLCIYPAIAGHSENDPADAWQRLQREGSIGVGIEGRKISVNGAEIADYIFRQWVKQDAPAAIAAIKDSVPGKSGADTWQAHGMAAIVRSLGPDSVDEMRSLAEDPIFNQSELRTEIAAALVSHDLHAAFAFDPSNSSAVLTRWTHDDPDAALAYATSLGTQEALLAVAKGLLRDDPRRAMDLLYSLNDPEAATALLKSWQPGDANDGAWPVFPGAAPRVNATTRTDAIFIALHRLQPPE